MRLRAVLLMSLWMLQLLFFGPIAPPAVADEAVAPSVVEQNPPDALVMSLEECIKATLENNLDIAVNSFAPRRSDALVTLEESVFDPLLTGSANALRNETRQLDQFGRPIEFENITNQYVAGFEDPLTTGGRYRIDFTAQDDQTDVAFFDNAGNIQRNNPTTTNVNFTLTFTQPLLRNLGPDANKWLIVVAQNNLGISEQQFRQTLLDNVALTEQAYWDLNFTLMELKTVRASLQQARDFLEQNKIKVRVGTLAPIEITQAEAQVADRDQDLIIAEFAVLAAEDELRRVMGVDNNSPDWMRPLRPSEAPQLKVVTPDLKESIAAAEANRPDLEQARLQIASDQTAVMYRKNQRRWGLDFEGVGGYQGVGFDQFNTSTVPPTITGDATYNDAFTVMRDRELPSWRLSLLLSVPIGNRAAKASYIDAKYAAEQSHYQLEQVEQLALVEVRNAVRRVVTDLKRVTAAQVNTRLQREKLEAEQKKFENGMSTSFEVLTFQTDLARAETVQNRAIVDYNKSLVELERVQGTLLQARGIMVPTGEADDPEQIAALRSAKLRGLWKKSSIDEGELTYLTQAEPTVGVQLPERFEFRGGQLSGIGGDAFLADDGSVQLGGVR